jgi:mannose-6-phosphate isomerase
MKEAQVLAAATANDNNDQADDDDDFLVDESRPYAELWLGTHGNGMSYVTIDDDDNKNSNDNKNNNSPRHESLQDYVARNPSLHCGQSELGFLLKVLSVRKVLSIQAHPDKALAAQLHAERPSVYKDPNHKPEMAICLSDTVRAMCGFRVVDEIQQHVREYPELQHVLGAPLVARVLAWQPGNDVNEKELLRTLFHAYVAAPAEVLATHVDALVQRLRQLRGGGTELQRLMLQLAEQFPGDCGIFAPLLLNVVELTTNEGLFINANEPHAYISGEILECMACSDNVVRAGLTPKLKDVPTLVHMLTYQTGVPVTTHGRALDACLRRYAPPVRDFLVDVIDVPPGETYLLEAVDSPAVLLTLEGEACLKQHDRTLDVSFGLAAFLSARTTCSIVAGPYGVRLTRACTNIEY